MKLNQKDLLLQAQLEGLFLPVHTTPGDIIDFMKRHRAGENIDVGSMDHPLLELSTIMMSWVEDHFDTISAQHDGIPDCITCQETRKVKCFIENMKTLIRGGYINQENPWLLKR